MKNFKENAKDVKFYVTTPNDAYFDFCKRYKNKTGESCLMHESVHKHTTNSSKWMVSAKITFSADNKYIHRLKNDGYKIKKKGNRYEINDLKLFWKLIDLGYRI